MRSVFEFAFDQALKVVNLVIPVNNPEGNLALFGDLVDTAPDIIDETVVFKLVDATANRLLVAVDLVGDVGTKIPSPLQLCKYQSIRRELQPHCLVGKWGHT